MLITDQKDEPTLIDRDLSGMLKFREKKSITDLDLKNKRVLNITLTKRGRQVHTQSQKRESIKKVMSCLSVAERQQLSLLLDKVRLHSFKILNIAHFIRNRINIVNKDLWTIVKSTHNTGIGRNKTFQASF